MIRLTTWFVCLLVFFFSFTTIYSQDVTLENPKVVYELPYPGLLPDHPLYYVKITRDRITEFLTRNPIKKAEIYLSFSDKRVAMAMALAKKGKNKQAISTISKAEKYFVKIPDLLKTSKQRGVSPPADLVLKLKLSNLKHREVIETLLKDLPQGDRAELKEVLRINTEIKQALDTF